MASDSASKSMSPTEATEMAHSFLKSRFMNDDYTGWGHAFFKEGLSFLSAEMNPARMVFLYTCNARHCNSSGNLHGGCAATLFDFTTSCPLGMISSPGFWQMFGVSRTLNVTYIRPIPEGLAVRLEVEVVHAGKRLATTKGTMTRQSDGAILATCEHGKVNVDPPVEKL